MLAAQPWACCTIWADCSSDNAGASRPSRSAASSGEKRNSAKVTSVSWPPARSRWTGSASPRRLATMTRIQAGRCCRNVANEVETASMSSRRCKSSSTSTRGSPDRSHRSSSSAWTAGTTPFGRLSRPIARSAHPGASRSSAASTPCQNATGSRSFSSTDNQACCNELASTQLRSREVLPEPAGATTRVNDEMSGCSINACRRGRRISCCGFVSGRSFDDGTWTDQCSADASTCVPRAAAIKGSEIM